MPRRPPLKDQIERWIEDCERRMLSDITIVDYRRRMKRVYEYASRNDWPMNAKKLKPKHLRDFYQSISHLSTASQKVYTDAFLLFAKYHKNQELSEIRLRITVSRTRVDWLTEEQVADVLRNARRPFQSAMVVLFAYTGMRASEVTNLRMKDVNRNQITVRGKGRKERIIPIDTEFWSMVAPYMEWRDTVTGDYFLMHPSNGNAKQYATSSVRMSLMDLGKKLNHHLSPHTLRRSWGRHLYKRGCPLGELQHLMGHASVEQTMKYLGIGEWDVGDAIRLYRPSYKSQIAQKVYLTPSVQSVD